MTHPQRKCSTLQNTLCFIICELLTDGDQRLTDFCTGIMEMGGSFKLSVMETREAFLQTEAPYSGTVRGKLLLFSPQRSSPNLAREAAVESKQKCVVFCGDLINTVLASP